MIDHDVRLRKYRLMRRPLRSLIVLNDPVLRPYISAEDDVSGSRALEQVLGQVVRPTIRRVLQRALRTSAIRADELDDLEAGVVLRLIEKLQAIPFFEDDAVRKLDDYVARLTYNVISDVRRLNAPERARLKRRLRYVLGSDPRITSWEGANGTLCGLAEWCDRVDAVQQFTFNASTVHPELTDDRRAGDALVHLFRMAGAPMLLEEATTVLARLWNVTDKSSLRRASTDRATNADPSSLYDRREELQIVWREILRLPQQQRTALLLNLRDAFGLNAVELFPLTRAATLDDVAAAAGVSAAKLTQMWSRMPLRDQEIADMLGVTRQQIINFRKSARERLRRRIARREGNRGGTRQ